MNGKTCIVTGANSGIGKATALGLAKLGATVIMVCRDPKRGEEARVEVSTASGNASVEMMQCDMASFASIRAFAAAFLARHPRLDVLVNNAAIVPGKRETTADGFEMQWQVNHLAYFLLTHLLLDRLRASAPARIVNVASTLHTGATINFDDLQSEKRYSALKTYGVTKLANVLFTYELARRLEGTCVTCNCLHPGGVRTNIGSHGNAVFRGLFALAGPLMLSPEKGARTSIYLASSPKVEGVTGKYFNKSAEAASSPESRDKAVAARLWDITATMTGVA